KQRTLRGNFFRADPLEQSSREAFTVTSKGTNMFSRRSILALGLMAATTVASPLHAEDKPTEIRIGTQKGGFFPAVRQRQTLEAAFKP
ncbi:hypothetical protein, partial [Clostridium perfringens]